MVKSADDVSEQNFVKNRFLHPKGCPNCGNFSIKDNNCNHITCSICGTHWCWFCKELIHSSDNNHNCKYGKWATENHNEGLYGLKLGKKANEVVVIIPKDLLPWEREENFVPMKKIIDFLRSHGIIVNVGDIRFFDKEKREYIDTSVHTRYSKDTCDICSSLYY